MIMKIAYFSAMMQCIHVEVYRYFGQASYHHQGLLIRPP